MRFKCTSCGQTVSVDDGKPGEAVQCGSCGTVLKVPKPFEKGYIIGDFCVTEHIGSGRMGEVYKAYQEKNHTLPTKYAIRGFDIMYDALVRIASHTYFYEGLQAGISSRVSAIFNYLEKPLVGFENNGVLLIQYNKDLLPVVLE